MLCARAPHHYVDISLPARHDLDWWWGALLRFNGTAAIAGAAQPPRLFQTDARGLWDSAFPCAGVFIDGGFATLPAARCRALFADAPADDTPIAVWELFAVLAAARLFGPYMAGRAWCVLCDNAAATAWITKGTEKGDVCFEHAVYYLKQLFWEAVTCGFRLTARHIPGSDNALADALSRLQWRRFKGLLVGWAVTHRVPAPASLTFLPPDSHA